MNKYPHRPDHNVVRIPVKALKGRGAARDLAGHAAAPAATAAVGSPNDPRVKEAMRLMGAFLAIEDRATRSALITMAERLVSYDWVRNIQQR